MTEYNTSKKQITLHFVPRVDKKQWANRNCKSTNSQKLKAEGTFRGVSIEVFDTNIKILLENGDYGCINKCHRSHTAKSKENDEEEKEYLTLNLEEAFFLSYYLDVLNILNEQNTPLEWNQMLCEAQKVNPKFLDYLASYLYLKSKGWTIKSGIKFGVNYLIYKEGPQFYHASFGVKILTSDQQHYFKTHNMKCLQRIAETSNKDLMLLQITTPINFQMSTLHDISQYSVSELIIRRFNCTGYVQHFDTH